MLLAGCLCPGLVSALPNSIVGPLLNEESPLNGQDLTQTLLSGDLWDGTEPLPGKWNEEGQIASATICSSGSLSRWERA